MNINIKLLINNKYFLNCGKIGLLMTLRTTSILKVLNVLSWIIFVGLCIQTGGFIFNTIYVLFIHSVGATKFWGEINLSALLRHDRIQFISLTVIMIFVSLLKTLLFYRIVKIFHDKKLDLANPFQKPLGQYLFRVSYLAFGIGLFSYLGYTIVLGLDKQGVTIPSLQQLQIGGADVWLLMGVTLYVFAQIFKKGIEIQSENNLTI